MAARLPALAARPNGRRPPLSGISTAAPAASLAVRAARSPARMASCSVIYAVAASQLQLWGTYVWNRMFPATVPNTCPIVGGG